MSALEYLCGEKEIKSHRNDDGRMCGNRFFKTMEVVEDE